MQQKFILSQEEKEKILKEFNSNQMDYDFQKTYTELFSLQVAKTPERLALVYENKRYTYKELDDITNSLAVTLRKKGLCTNEIVPILVERSADIIIGAISVMKAGGAYLPVDPKYPQSRIDYMLLDSKARFILGHASLKEKTVGFQGEWLDFADESLYAKDFLQSEVSNINSHSDLCYIIYTSGSTGKPKGVMIQHYNLVNLCLWKLACFAVSKEDNAALYSGFGFDASVWDSFPTLLSGAALHVIPESMRLSIEQLDSYFADCGITNTLLPTQFGEQFMELAENSKLRFLTVGGDKLRVFKNRPYKLINAYGPTEYTVAATAFVLENGIEYSNIPIGKPLGNTWAYVLDKEHNLLPIGEPGELCIAGAQMAKGYLNREDLTKERFILNPYATCILNQKMYLTGDLVRWLPDGNLEFLGRIDEQVKIRGFRIELGEIEQAFMKHEEINDACVLARDDENGNKYLCAYFTAEKKLSLESLNYLLAKDLPEFMIPPYMMQLHSLPLTANGKVDKKALPLIELRKNEVSYVAPRNEIEEKLVELWQDILGVKKVGINDSFFGLGGNSLKMVVLASKIQKIMQIKIPVSELFNLKTLACMAERLLKTKKETFGTIEHLKEADDYSVAPAQKGMYILESMHGIGNAYHLVVPIELLGRLSKERLGKAIDAVVAQHESLRTVFVLDQGEVRQKVLPQINIKKIIRTVDEKSIDSAIADFLDKFQLGEAPLFKVGLFEINAFKNVLVLEVHHIVFDGYSLGVFLEDLFTVYNGLSLEKPMLQYRDYAAWHANFLQNEGKKQEEYWLKQLAGELPLLNLVADFPRPATKKFTGKKVFATLEKDLTYKIKDLVKEQDSTLFIVLLSAYYVLLSRYAGQEEIIVGSPFSGRSHPDFEKMIGMFVNVLPLRAYPKTDKTFVDFIKEVRQMVMEANDNQDYTLEKMVEVMGLKRDASRNPLFDVVFAFLEENFDFGASQAGLKIKMRDYDAGEARFDLLLYTYERDENIDLFLEYAEHLYKKESMERFCEHFINLLADVTENPHKKLIDFNLTSNKEQKILLSGFNNNLLAVPLDKPYHILFQEQVQKTPDNIALVFKNVQYTYQELAEKTSLLAAVLKKYNVQKNDIVPVMVERSNEMVIAAIAVMKAGAAYLPLDTNYPKARLDYMLEDSKAKIILSQPSLKEKFAQFKGEFIDVTAANQYSAEPLKELCEQSGDDLAAIIYTSGSTGQPKGTMILHRNIVNMCYSENKDNEMTKDDIVGSYASFSFDAAMWSNFAPLLKGATVHIVPEEIRMSLMDLNEYFDKHKVTVTFMTTQLCEQFIDLAQNKYLRVLATGGEKFKTFRPTRYQVVNGYGPTEYTVYTTRFIVDKQYDNIPIGKPLANTWVYVLDKKQKLQPIGVPGELCVAGAQLSKGYFNRPEMTKEKFILNPYATSSLNELMYRTGDLVRWLPDGNIEFLGRIDQQVKIRGFRIELAEIGTEIKKQANVEEAVVVDLEDGSGTKYLATYVVPKKLTQKLDFEKMRSVLGNALPDYMIPAQFVQLEKLPLNANGKVDKAALPKPVLSQEQTEFVMPKTASEQKIAKVWQEVLGIEKISAKDNFFHLGGNSIKAISAVAKLQKNFVISINDLFTHQVLMDLANNVKMVEDNLKTRLASLKNLESEMEKPQPDFVKQILAERQKEYEKQNKYYETLDLSKERNYQGVLVTGATGYLGVHLVHELLRMCDCMVYVIVRGKNKENALERLLAKFNYYFGEKAWLALKADKRVAVLCGELDKEKLSLNNEEYDLIAKNVDCIIHSAANVRHYGVFEESYAHNVVATEQLLELAKCGQPKYFHHISTMSVALGEIENIDYHVFTESEVFVGQKHTSHYVETKILAERAVVKAREAGIKANIYRAGNIAFQSDTGLFQENITENAFFSLLKAYVNIGCVPNKLDEAEFSYVDKLAQAIILISKKPALDNEIFHMQNPELVKMSEALTVKELGLNIKQVTLTAFIDELERHFEKVGFKNYIEQIMTHMGWMAGAETKEKTTVEILSERTAIVLKRIGFSWPKFVPQSLNYLLRQALKERMLALKENKVLSILTEEERWQLAQKAKMQVFDRRKSIVYEKMASKNVYFLMKGFASLMRSSAGGWTGMVGMVKKGELLGWEVVVTEKEKMLFSAEATLGDVLVLALPCDKLSALIKSNNDASFALLNTLQEKVDKLSKLVVSLG